MRVGVISDTHDQLPRTRLAVRLLQTEGAEALIHCGDLTGPEIVAACSLLPFYFTFGNHDADRVPCLQRAAREAGATCLDWGGEVVLADRRIAVAHGHLHIDVRRLMARQPHFLLSGHSHIAADWREGPTRRVNPGALYRADEFTATLIDLGADDVRFLPIALHA